MHRPTSLSKQYSHEDVQQSALPSVTALAGVTALVGVGIRQVWANPLRHYRSIGSIPSPKYDQWLFQL